MSINVFHLSPREIARQVLAADGMDLVLRLTLLMLLLGPIGNWTVRCLVLLLGGAGLVFPVVLRQPLLWIGLTMLTGWRVIDDYPLADNHSYLLCYWCLAIACALLSRQSIETLAFQGKVLIGLVFLLATVQKAVISPDFRSGVFFRYTLSADQRFENFASLAGGVHKKTIEANREYLQSDKHTTSSRELEFNEPPSLRRLALVMTWGTLALEFALAAAFLWPRKDWIYRQRNNLLIVFCLTTYAVATVAGFGRLLIVMGLAQCSPEARDTRLAFIATYGLILIYEESPWLSVLANG
jgi:hypothetical protein